MIFWSDDLKRIGFREYRDHYWQCDRGHGLEADMHFSLFLWDAIHFRNLMLTCYSVTEFHVTFHVPGHHLHFYYHERRCNDWEPGGHTSTAEVSQIGYDLVQLRELADRAASRLVEAMNGNLSQRRN